MSKGEVIILGVNGHIGRAVGALDTLPTISHWVAQFGSPEAKIRTLRPGMKEA